MLVSAMALDELERVRGIERDLDGLSNGWRTAYAVNKPEELVKAGQEARRRMKLAGEPVQALHSVDEVLAKVRKAARIARRKRKGR